MPIVWGHVAHTHKLHILPSIIYDTITCTNNTLNKFIFIDCGNLENGFCPSFSCSLCLATMYYCVAHKSRQAQLFICLSPKYMPICDKSCSHGETSLM